MARYIDADKLKQDDELTLWLSMNPIRTGKELKRFSQLFVDKIDKTPTEDVRPVVRGKWIDEFLGDMMCVCSICGQKITKGYFSHNFCPNCGADMREVEE
jgi:hypothetical protein